MKGRRHLRRRQVGREEGKREVTPQRSRHLVLGVGRHREPGGGSAGELPRVSPPLGRLGASSGGGGPSSVWLARLPGPRRGGSHPRSEERRVGKECRARG